MKSFLSGCLLELKNFSCSKSHRSQRKEFIQSLYVRLSHIFLVWRSKQVVCVSSENIFFLWSCQRNSVHLSTMTFENDPISLRHPMRSTNNRKKKNWTIQSGDLAPLPSLYGGLILTRNLPCKIWLMIFKAWYNTTADSALNWNLNTKTSNLSPSKQYLRYQGKGQSFALTKGKLASQFWLAIFFLMSWAGRKVCNLSASARIESYIFITYLQHLGIYNKKGLPFPTQTVLWFLIIAEALF